jgi:hypothetical protein
MGKGALLLIPVLLLSSEFVHATTPVRVLYMGDAISVHYLTPYMFMNIEPLVDVTPVIASEVVARHSFGMEGVEMMKRALRLYIPRSYGRLVDGQDVIILSDATLFAFDARHVEWFSRSVVDDGLALMMAGGVESYRLGGWHATTVADVLPVDCLPDATGPGQAVIFNVSDELLTSIPWGSLKAIPFGGSNMVAVRGWGIPLADFSVTAGGSNPMMVVGDIGLGRSFAFTPDWTFGWGESFSRWEYYGDFCNNLMLYLARRRVPQEIELVHRARRALLDLDVSRGLLISLLDFVDKFGANPRRLDEMIARIDELQSSAELVYMDQDFSRAVTLIEEALEAEVEAEVEAIKVKEEALLWVYAIEWFTVSGTLLVAGLVVWSLMIRRCYFREVGSTRFPQEP